MSKSKIFRYIRTCNSDLRDLMMGAMKDGITAVPEDLTRRFRREWEVPSSTCAQWLYVACLTKGTAHGRYRVYEERMSFVVRAKVGENLLDYRQASDRFPAFQTMKHVKTILE